MRTIPDKLVGRVYVGGEWHSVAPGTFTDDGTEFAFYLAEDKVRVCGLSSEVKLVREQ